eukprot:2496767-Prymnesium_polylepis.2
MASRASSGSSGCGRPTGLARLCAPRASSSFKSCSQLILRCEQRAHYHQDVNKQQASRTSRLAGSSFTSCVSALDASVSSPWPSSACAAPARREG